MRDFLDRMWLPALDVASGSMQDLGQQRANDSGPHDWSRVEVLAAIADYFDMLTRELQGELFNKAEHNRRLQRLLDNRSHGSIERKHQNISAILIELGYPYVEGYKPLRNYQELLRSVVEDELRRADPLHRLVAADVDAQIAKPPPVGDVLSIEVAAPLRSETESKLYTCAETTRPAVGKDYLEIEARNRSLGRAGEELILQFEHERLWRAGHRELADRIEHVSISKGDYLGFDVLSFEEDGRDRLIEVKTTRYGAMTPFFASRNEVDVSEVRWEQYQLYRLFAFRKEPRLFLLSGSLRNTCRLNPIAFSATPG